MNANTPLNITGLLRLCFMLLLMLVPSVNLPAQTDAEATPEPPMNASEAMAKAEQAAKDAEAAAKYAEEARLAAEALAAQEALVADNATSEEVPAAEESTPAAAETTGSYGAVVEDASTVVALPQGVGDVLWLVLAAVLVFFMQAGFAMVESGMTRAKNACNIMMKNMLDFSFATLAYWVIGYALMYGELGNSIFGWDPDLAILGLGSHGDDNMLSAGFLFQVVFCGTAATIVGGAMAERTKFIGYVIYSVLISALIYPIAGHWIWAGDGWLAAMGMRDFAGSTVVHSVGAWAGLAGAITLGPRLGKYDAEGKPRPIPGHNLPMATLGGFILWFGWFGFNAGSTLAAVDGLAHVAVTTILAACAGTAASTLTTWIKFGKPDLTMTINGALAGLVSITAPCASVSTTSAFFIGAIGGILVVYSVLFIEKVTKVDDPVGAISVHGVCGVWGTLSIGIFGSSAIDALYWSEETAIKDGLLLGGGSEQLLIQAAGVIAVFAFTFMFAYVLFSALSKTVGLRVSREEEIDGLDISEHGNEAYADFKLYIDEDPDKSV